MIFLELSMWITFLPAIRLRDLTKSAYIKACCLTAEMGFLAISVLCQQGGFVRCYKMRILFGMFMFVVNKCDLDAVPEGRGL